MCDIKICRLIGWAIVIMFSSYSMAQSRIVGTIVDEKGKPLDAVDVGCFSCDSVKLSTTLSDEKGTFSLKVPDAGKYMLRLACVGFKDAVLRLDVNKEENKLGQITMHSASVQLAEVEVQAQTAIRQIDRTLLFPTKEQKKHAFNGYNVLYNMMIADLDVDPFTKEIKRHNQDVVLCINGREAKPHEIEQMDPRDIRRIDCYDYHPEFPMQTVVDFVLINRQYGGNVNVNARQALTRVDGKANASAQVYYKKHEFSAGVSDTYQNFTQDKTSQSDYQFRMENGSVLNSREKGLPMKNKGNNVNAYLQYLHTMEHDRLSAQLWINAQRPDVTSSSVHTYDWDEFSTLSTNKRTRSKNRAPGGMLSYEHYFQNQSKLTVSMIYNYGSNTYTRTYQAWNDGALYDDNLTDIVEHYHYYNPRIKYMHNFKNGLSLNMMLEHVQQNIYSTHTGTNEGKEKYLSGKTTGIVSMAKQWDKVMSALTLMGGWQTTEQEQKHHEFVYNGQFMLQYMPSKKHMVRAMMAAVYAPLEFKWRSTIDQSMDFMQIKRGNPDLKDIKAFDVMFDYSYNRPWGTLGATLENQFYLDNFSIYTYRENDKFVHSYYSGGHAHILVGEVRGSVNLIPKMLTLKANGGYRRGYVDSWKTHRVSTWIYGADLLLTYKGWMASAKLRSRQISEEFVMYKNYSGATHNFNIGYASNALNVVLDVRNPFHAPRKYGSYFSVDYRESSKNYMVDRGVFLTVSYRFRFGNKKHRFSEVEIESVDNGSAILH